MSKVIILVLFICLYLPVCNAREINLIRAQVDKVKFKKLNFENRNEMPSSWEIKLKKVELIQGASKNVPKKLKVVINSREADHLIGKEIFLVIDTINQTPVVLYWDEILMLACVPESLVNLKYESFYFDDKWGRMGVKCMFIRDGN